MLVSSYITPKARKGAVSGIEGRGLIATEPIAAGELVAIKGGHIVTTAAVRALPELLQNSEIQIADGVWAVISTPLNGARATVSNGGLIAGKNGVLAIEGFQTPEGRVCTVHPLPETASAG